MNMNTNSKTLSLLSRLRSAVNKLRLILSSTVLSRTWKIASVIRRASSLPRRHLSFNYSDRLPSGLDMICDSDEVITSPEGSSASPGGQLIRTTSCSSDDDINKRAEMFINNFRRQLQMERQISLQLRYGRANSSELSP